MQRKQLKSTLANVISTLSLLLLLGCAGKASTYFAGEEKIKIGGPSGDFGGLFYNAALRVCDDSLIISVAFWPYPITMRIKSGTEPRHGDYVGYGETIKTNDSMYYFNPKIYRTKDAKIKIDSLRIFGNEGDVASLNFAKDTLSSQSEFHCSAYSCQENFYEPFIGSIDNKKSYDTLISHDFRNGIRIDSKDKIRTYTYISGSTNDCKFEEVIKNHYELDRGSRRLHFYK